MTRMYGEYRKFEHEPSQIEIRKALMRIGKRLASALKRKGFKLNDFKFEHVIRENTNSVFPVWTVATKATEKVK